MSLRFRQIQAFHAIIETGTVTGAASILGISQPGISNLLSQLEHQTKLKLFERTRGRLIPTPEARILFQEADTLIRGLDHVSQSVLDLQNKNIGQLTVASQHSMSFGFMPQLISRFARDRPDMTISFQSQYSAKIQEWVASGLFEIGLCEMPPLNDGLEYFPLKVSTSLAMHDDSPLAEYDVLTPERLAGEPFIVMGPDHMATRRTREAFDKAGIPLRMRVHSHLFKNLLGFVKVGMGVAILDQFVTEYDLEGGFITRPFRPEIHIEMAIITSKTRPMSSIGQEFLTVLKDELAPYVA